MKRPPMMKSGSLAGRHSSDSAGSSAPGSPYDSKVIDQNDDDDFDDTIDEAKAEDGCVTPQKTNPAKARPAGAAAVSGETVQVYLRVRPLIIAPRDIEIVDGLDEKEIDHRRRLRAAHEERVRKLKDVMPTVQPVSDNSVELAAPETSQSYKNGEAHGTFAFSKVLGPDAQQEEVFRVTTLPLVNKLFTGTNGLIFAYGVTNSGKTFTMQGTPENPGIVIHLLKEVFARIDRARTLAASSASAGEDSWASAAADLTVDASYLEIYQEKLFDLLLDGRADPKQRQPISVVATSTDEIRVRGLSQMRVATLKDALSVIERGSSNRVMAHTQLNAESSRSHSVFTVTLTNGKGATWAKLSVCDLAGAERSSKTGAAAGGMRQNETNKINASLMQLGRCLEAVRFNQLNPKQPQRVVPFRDSKLTFLFRDVLTGHGSMAMICNVNPSPTEYDETLHTLKYASVAREIRVASRVDTKRPGTGARKPAVSRLGAGDFEVAEEVAAATASLTEQLSVAAGERDALNKALSNVHALLAAAERRGEALLGEVYTLRRERVLAAEREVRVEEATRAQVWEEMRGEMRRQKERHEKRLEAQLLEAEARMQRRLVAHQEKLLASHDDATTALVRAAKDTADAVLATALKTARNEQDRAIAQARAEVEVRLAGVEAERKAVVAAAETAREEAEDARAASARAAQDLEERLVSTTAAHAAQLEHLAHKFNSDLRSKEQEVIELKQQVSEARAANAKLEVQLQEAQAQAAAAAIAGDDDGPLGGIRGEIERAQLLKRLKDSEAHGAALRRDCEILDAEASQLRIELERAKEQAMSAEVRLRGALEDAAAAKGAVAAVTAKQRNPRRLTDCLQAHDNSDELSLLPQNVQDALRGGVNAFGIEDDGAVGQHASLAAAAALPAVPKKPARAGTKKAAAAAAAADADTENESENATPAVAPTPAAKTSRRKRSSGELDAAAAESEPVSAATTGRATRARVAKATEQTAAVDSHEVEQPARATRATRASTRAK